MEKKNTITQALQSAYSFTSYLELIESLHQEKKATSFQEDESFYNYSNLGLSRMKRVFKTVKLNNVLADKVSAITTPQTWLLITESWCGDASQTVPIIARLAELNTLIDLKIVLRDSNEELMSHFLTDGGKSIPILAILSDQREELHRWGPRPEPVQQKVIDYKNMAEPKPPYQELSAEIQKWYNKDKGALTQQELNQLL